MCCASCLFGYLVMLGLLLAVLFVCLIGWLDLFVLFVYCGSLCAALSGFEFMLFVVYCCWLVGWVACLLIVGCSS